MQRPRLDRVVFLSGAGLSAASGVPTFRAGDGLWEGHDVQQVATPEGWRADAALVRRFYDARRVACEAVSPNPGHFALARLQREWGPDRVTLVTQNIDGLLTAAGAESVLEMHGSLGTLRCEVDDTHPRVVVRGCQDAGAMCALCGASLRPDIVWFGEVPFHMSAIEQAVLHCTTFVSVGTSGVVYPAAGLARAAKSMGAYTLEINPVPSGGPFDEVVSQGSEIALPSLVDRWVRGQS